MSDSNYQAQLFHHFCLEAPELLSTIEQALLNLQAGKNNFEQVRILMRATHTLKSIAATLGFETIKNIAHTLEDVFRAIQTPEVVIDSEMQALFFESYECLRDPLMAKLTGSHIDTNNVIEAFSTVLTRLQTKLGNFLIEEQEDQTATEVSFESIKMLLEDSICPELEKTAVAIAHTKPKDSDTILRNLAELFRGYGQAIGLLGFLAIAEATIAALDQNPRAARTISRLALEDFRSCCAEILKSENPEAGCPSAALLQLTGSAFLPQSHLVTGELKKVAISTQKDAQIIANEVVIAKMHETQPTAQTTQPVEFLPLSEEINNTPTTPFPKVVRVNVDHLEQLNYLNAELLTNQNRQFLQDGKKRSSLRKLLNRWRQFQQMLTDLQDWSNPLLMPYKLQNKGNLNFVRAVLAAKNSDNFDILELDTYSEFYVIIQNLLEVAAEIEQEIDTFEQLKRQTTQLLKKQQKLLTNSRDVLLEARMLPLGSILNRLYPVLEQLQKKHNKQIKLNIKGDEVLVDKAIAERLYEPLLHLVRNAFDHGIESPQIRELRKKPTIGQIEIRAYYQGSQLIIDVHDDGEGLDFDAIRQHAIEQGLITAEKSRLQSESQLAELLFEPGFSTAKQVNDISGRGVGLDVVKVQLHTIQGSVAVHSETQKSTTFSLQIPLNLSINKLLVCQAGKKVYALAVDTIDQILLPKTGQIQYSEHGRVLRLATNTNSQLDEGELVRIYRLEEILDYSSRQPAQIASEVQTTENNTVLPLLIVLCQEQVLALEVDRIIWEQELVIRPFSKLVPTPGYIHGGTILADGRLTLVINGAGLLDHILNQEMQVMKSWKQTWIGPPTHLLTTNSQPKAALPAKIEDNKRTVVIVDDSITLRQALVFTLQKAGYHTLQARDGYEAISLCQAQQHVDLIICDIEMPRMNGFEFLAHCTSDKGLSQIPILILSSRTAVKHRQLALKLGASAYLTKPYSDQELILTLSQIIACQGTSLIYS
ncbi:hybrid sensor histidine kinase/response regulator [Nostoc sp. CENA67]|uniref:histidine kinase n=1 Tax=Amazonocrinis nigriterrae CENA67 TaxID=2794033 RepID=A0A8J7L5B9_9NOST|nr:hybrid sensor histidine kinase/response regulator [Amazonocrinis nigriterrae]MBH8561094.1 hybrid sensor histidine kinase/response regulator [Amazonocrinis nigriterrae CENA67]